MKKRFLGLALIPTLAACSPAAISVERAKEIVVNLTANLQQIKEFSYYEENEITADDKTKTIKVCQVFFAEKYIHFYEINEDSVKKTNNHVTETWKYVKDDRIHTVVAGGKQDFADPKKVESHIDYSEEEWNSIINPYTTNLLGSNEQALKNISVFLDTKSTTRNLVLKSGGEKSLFVEASERLLTANAASQILTYEFNDGLLIKQDRINEQNSIKHSWSYNRGKNEIRYPEY